VRNLRSAARVEAGASAVGEGDERQHHRHFNEDANNGCKGRAGVQAEEALYDSDAMRRFGLPPEKWSSLK
jgi:hypothetical protein